MPLQQIKDRKLVQWALAYFASAWALLQLAEFLWGLYGWPEGILRAMPIFVAIGFLVAIVLAWFHGEKGRQRVGGVEFAMLTGIMILAGGVFYMLRQDARAEVVDVAQSDPAAVEQGSIAVLPFTDMSPNKDQAWFSDGLSEELLNVLAQLPELRVAARTSAFAFRDSKVSIDSIARALRVEYVLEGSVRTVADRVRITAQLIKAGTGFHVWSETYDRDLKDVFAVQDEISKAIVDALRIRIGGGRTGVSLAQVETRVPEAHQLVLKALHAYREGSNTGIAETKRLAEDAIRLDPNYARAYAVLSFAHTRTAYRRIGDIDTNYALAEKNARRGIERGPKVPYGYVALARVLAYHEWNFAEAERLLEKAIALNPGFADAYDERAWLLMRLGRPQESIASARRAVSLDPMSMTAYNTLGAMYAYSDQNAASIEAYKSALAIKPGDMIVSANIALSYSNAGDKANALTAAVRALAADSTDYFANSVMAFVKARMGDRTYAERFLRERGDESPYGNAMIHVALGNHDEAFRQLERAVEIRDDFTPDLGVDDVFDPLRNDPRMNVLLRKIGVPVPQAS